MKLSVITPAIRTERWVDMYNSIDKAFSGEWELIIVTSKELPDELKDKKNIKVIYSRRSPMAKQQIGFCEAQGEYVTVVSDDSVWMEGALDKVFANGVEDITVMKYLEGKEFAFPEWYLEQVAEDMRFKTNYDFMRADKYYWTDTHDSSKMPGIPHHSPILSVALLKRELIGSVGGWDCRFQSQAMGNIDLAARLMILGYSFKIADIVVSKCGYMEQDTGDHSAIHYAQLEDDQPLLDKLYAEKTDRGIINLENWKDSDEVWGRGGDAN